MNNNANYVFISYSTRNQQSADAMRDLINNFGIKTWMAPGDIPPGSKYAKVINRAVKECSCFVLMLSEDAQESVWVAKEVERAVNYRKTIIPVQIEDVMLNDEFELYLSTDQVIAVNKIDEGSEDIKKLIDCLHTYVKTDECDTESSSSANITTENSQFDTQTTESNNENQKLLLSKANSGDADAQYLLGLKYSEKNSAIKDYHKAFQWFNKAAENGNVDAMIHIARLYRVGLGCNMDTFMEQHWYRKAMEAGSKIAIYLLADALDHGHCDHGKIGKTEQEKKEAILLYKKAAELGFVEASKSLAFIYLRQKDDENAIYWFHISAEQGDAECQLYYAKALYYSEKDDENEHKKREAFMWYKKAANQGNSIAQYALARNLFYGIGIQKDESSAFTWCNKAAKQGLYYAQITLSIMFGRGIGTNQDSNKSEYWYRIAKNLIDAEEYKKQFFEHVKLLSDSYPIFDEDFSW